MILVYGPSGVGKTAAFRFAMGRVCNAEFTSLDDVAADFGRRNGTISYGQGAGDLLPKLGADKFLQIAIKAAKERLEASQGQDVVLDIGAGFLESPLAGAWLSSCECVVFEASPEVVYARHLSRLPREVRTIEHYTAQEFSPRRRAYYALANHRVAAERGPDEVGRSFVQLILELTNPAPTAASE
jgi:adenylate kinase